MQRKLHYGFSAVIVYFEFCEDSLVDDN